VTEPPNTEALLRIVSGKGDAVPPLSPERQAALDAIASELKRRDMEIDRLRTMRQHNYEGALADLHAAEAERDELRRQLEELRNG
jgi:hypothetical protein